DAAPPARLLLALEQLASWARIYVLSGRSAEQLDRWLGRLPIGLVCEHGLAIKEPGAPWPSAVRFADEKLEFLVAKLFEEITERTPGSWIEWKMRSIAWHCRGVDAALRAARLGELREVLRRRLPETFAVMEGARVIEVCRKTHSQGNAIRTILERNRSADLVFAAGTEPSDGELFAVVSRECTDGSLVCQIGSPHGCCVVETSDELLEVLERLGKTHATRTPAQTAA
ncbi:MAG TPA: trehalose-phosphatase, partial [Candidatus Cybelea sp.]|nr:trehalose-phosphatase [Candidatus Cybelea sp.]